MNLRITQARKHAKKESTLALKPRADITRSPKQGYQCPNEKDLRPRKLKKNSDVYVSEKLSVYKLYLWIILTQYVNLIFIRIRLINKEIVKKKMKWVEANMAPVPSQIHFPFGF